MARDPSALTLNVRLSIKRTLSDYFEAELGVPLVFDLSEAFPFTPSMDVKEWISVHYGPTISGNLSRMFISFYICTRNDYEGTRLQELEDALRELLATPTNLWSIVSGVWTVIGKISYIVRTSSEGFDDLGKDNTKVRNISAEVLWGSITG